MLYIEQTAGFATVDDFVEGVKLGGIRRRVEWDVSGGEWIRGGGAMSTSFIADVIFGATRLNGGFRRRRRRSAVVVSIRGSHGGGDDDVAVAEGNSGAMTVERVLFREVEGRERGIEETA